MANVVVYIDPNATLADDQAGEEQHELKVQGHNKSFHYDGQSYTLHPGERKSVPEIVATQWNSADSEVVISWDGFNTVI